MRQAIDGAIDSLWAAGVPITWRSVAMQAGCSWRAARVYVHSMAHRGWLTPRGTLPPASGRAGRRIVAYAPARAADECGAAPAGGLSAVLQGWGAAGR